MPWASVRPSYTDESMSEQKTIRVEVAYALPDRQSIVPLTVPEGTTALAAAQQR